MKFKQDVKLDGLLVHAAKYGFFMHASMMIGLQPSEASQRATWLKNQSQAYIDKVVDEVIRIEDEDEERRSQA